MSEKGSIIKIIYDSFDDLFDSGALKEKLEKSTSTVLFGPDSSLDSLALVSLIISVEERTKQIFSSSIALTDERAMAQKNSPFRTVDTLAEYINNLLKGDAKQ